MIFQDLIKYTPASHPDHAILTEALNMTQHFLDEFNIIQTKSMFPVSIFFISEISHKKYIIGKMFIGYNL